MYFVAFLSVAWPSFKYDFPFNSEGLLESPFYMIFAFPAALLAFVVTVSALIHILKYRRFGWLVPIIIFYCLAAYIYGYSVASNPEFAE